MSKGLKDLQWHPVTLEGFPITNSDTFQGFIGLEECTDYGLASESKKFKLKSSKKQTKDSLAQDISKKKQQHKRKSSLDSKNDEVSKKKVKLSNGFIVESCTDSDLRNLRPSQTNLISEESNRKQRKEKDNQLQSKEQKKTEAVKSIRLKVKKPKLGEVMDQKESNLTPEDMLTWSEFKLQEPIMKALTEMGFKDPTKIQQLTLPAAIHGRRDILGAAETGSGKTLAFGLPILSGILKIKEKAAAKGLDVYDIPYRTISAKKKNLPEDNIKEIKKYKKKNANQSKHKNKKGEPLDKNKMRDINGKESSEDGYSSGENDDSSSESENQGISIKKLLPKNKSKLADNKYIDEIEVPIKKLNNSADEGNDSDDDNYLHLSEVLDSDDLADDSDDKDSENEEVITNRDNKLKSNNDQDNVNADSHNDESESDDNDVESDGNESGSNADEIDADLDDDSEEEEQSDDEMDAVLGDDDEDSKTAGGIRCVKVIDDIELPGHVSLKTGKPLFALILTPTRELAIQISRHLIAVAKYTGIRIATIVGGMAAVKQERVLRSGPEVVVATPGRLWELIGQGQPHLQQLDTVKFLTIDETDRMIERGHFEELYPLLERLNIDEEKKSARQNFVFSATLTLVHDLPMHMKGKKVTKRGKIINRKIQKMSPEQKVKRLIDMIGMTDPKVVDITTQNLGTAETLTECRITCSLEDKDAYLYYLLKRHPGRSIVFCNSIGRVRRLATIFTILKCNPLPLHASMPQRQRLKNLERLRDDPHGVLIATDVAARGLDIPDVDHVIQYQVPRTAENYVHRSGRTARANKEGINVLMVEPSEAYLYSKLCLTLNKTADVPTFPVASHVLSTLKQLVVLARDLDALELKKKRAAQAHGWREKAARDMDMIIDDDDVPVQVMDPTIDRALKAKRRHLETMLSRPVFPRGFSFKYPSLNDPNALANNGDNALQVMKKAMESGEMKKEKRKSKNAPLLKLGKETKINRKRKNKKLNQ